MVINMLEAVHEMLEEDLKINMNVSVKCANIMLGKIIDGMKNNSESQTKQVIMIHTQEEKAPQRKIKPPRQDQYAIVLNDDKTIREIQGYPLEGLVKLDGKIMSHQNAIGKTFLTGELVDENKT